MTSNSTGPSREISAGLAPNAAEPPPPGRDGAGPLRGAAPPWVRGGPSCRRAGAGSGVLLGVGSGSALGHAAPAAPARAGDAPAGFSGAGALGEPGGAW